MILTRNLWIAVALAAAPLAGLAQSCTMLSLNIDDARSRLQRAARATELDEGRDQARRAKSSLDDAAMSAMDCRCDMAYMEFDDAATNARRARDASDPEQFVYNLKRAITAYNTALTAVRQCISDRQR